MRSRTSNLSTNKQHYDTRYADIDIESIVQKLEAGDTFLRDAILTDTSWHGLYYGDFRERIRGKQVLELGCGDGLNALIMAQLGAEVTAIDISEKSQYIIHAVCERTGLSVHALAGDFSLAPFPLHSFDFVIGKAFLHHLTHELEDQYLAKIVTLLKPDGEARFLEPAINSKFLDDLRWLVPVPGRPSKLNRRAFARWKESDPHPTRDNSTQHFVAVGQQYFAGVDTVMIGSIERLCRLLPAGNFQRRFRRWAHRVEPRLPGWFRHSAARSQLIIYQEPKG